MYYYQDKKHLVFGSEIKAILEHPDIKADVNYNVLDEYLTFQFILGNDTLFKNIFKLESGWIAAIVCSLTPVSG